MRRGRQRNVAHVDMGGGRIFADGARGGQHRGVGAPHALAGPPGGEGRPDGARKTGAGHVAYGGHYQASLVKPACSCARTYRSTCFSAPLTASMIRMALVFGAPLGSFLLGQVAQGGRAMLALCAQGHGPVATGATPPPPPGGDCGAFARQTMRCPDVGAADGGPGSGGTSASAGGGEGASVGLETVDR